MNVEAHKSDLNGCSNFGRLNFLLNQFLIGESVLLHTFSLLPPAASIDLASKMTIVLLEGLQFLAASISASSSTQYCNRDQQLVF